MTTNEFDTLSPGRKIKATLTDEDGKVLISGTIVQDTSAQFPAYSADPEPDEIIEPPQPEHEHLSDTSVKIHADPAPAETVATDPAPGTETTVAEPANAASTDAVVDQTVTD